MNALLRPLGRLGPDRLLRCWEYALEQLLDPLAEPYVWAPKALVLWPHLSALAPDLLRADTYLQPVGVRAARCDEVVAHLGVLVRATREHSGAGVLLVDFPQPPRSPLGIADAVVELGLRACVQRIDAGLEELARGLAGVQLVRASEVAARVGSWTDPRLHCLIDQVESRLMLQAMAQELHAHLRALRGERAKVLVLDLDNTLWGGVVGEAGLSGIRLGPSGRSRAYLDFQRACLDLRARGVLLAVASKNNPEDALEVFDQHPHMQIRREHVSAFQVHWEDKATSCRRIAEELNLSLDSLVFFDDSPVERSWVASACPEVHVVEVPEDASRYVETLQALPDFEAAVLSPEDVQRTELYQAERQRKAAASVQVDRATWLASLSTRLELGALDAFTLPRVAQLVGKTNQLNMTTLRRSEAEIEALHGEGHRVLWARVEDRFGDMGIVGVAILRLQPERWELDSFLLSCRVIKRGVEGAFLQGIAEAATSAGAKELHARYRPTRKNAPNRYLFRDTGFELVHESEDEVRYRLVLEPGWRCPQAEAHTIERVGLGAEGAP